MNNYIQIFDKPFEYEHKDDVIIISDFEKSDLINFHKWELSARKKPKKDYVKTLCIYSSLHKFVLYGCFVQISPFDKKIIIFSWLY